MAEAGIKLTGHFPGEMQYQMLHDHTDVHLLSSLAVFWTQIHVADRASVVSVKS